MEVIYWKDLKYINQETGNIILHYMHQITKLFVLGKHTKKNKVVKMVLNQLRKYALSALIEDKTQ